MDVIPVLLLVNADWLAHGRFDEEGSDVLPILLQQGHQKVDRKHNVGGQLILRHGDMPNGDTQAKHLFQLKLDRCLLLSNPLQNVIRVGDGSREFAGLVQTRTQQSGDLFDDGFGGQEKVIPLSQLLHLLLVLVHLLEVIHGSKFQSHALCLITMKLITKDTGTHLWLWCIRQTTYMK